MLAAGVGSDSELTELDPDGPGRLSANRLTSPSGYSSDPQQQGDSAAAMPARRILYVVFRRIAVQRMLLLWMCTVCT